MRSFELTYLKNARKLNENKDQPPIEITTVYDPFHHIYIYIFITNHRYPELGLTPRILFFCSSTK